MAAGEEEVVGPGAGYDAEKVREFFDKFDNDGSGNVSPEEFKELCQTMQPDMPDEDVAAALEQLDSDGDGEGRRWATRLTSSISMAFATIKFH